MASAERLAAVERELETWKRELVDVSGRNPLFSYRDLRVGTLELTPGESGVDCQALESLLAGDMVWMTALFPDEDLLVDARKRLKSIHRKALEHSEEKGIDTLFVAAGLATWQVETGNSSPNAPVVLIPFATTPDGAGQRDFKIERSGEPHLNPVLEHVLQTEHGVSLDGDAVGFGGETRMSFSEIKGTYIRGYLVRPIR